jgi:Galactose oxidase, central domain/Kelch motif
MSNQITQEYGTNLVVMDGLKGIDQGIPVALDFLVISATPISSNQVRVRFSLAPTIIDATNPANYSVPGVTITSVDFNSDDPTIFDLRFQQPLAPKTYVLTVSSTVRPLTSTQALQPPYQISFIVSLGNATPINGGAVNVSDTDPITQYLNPAYKHKPNWTSLTEALSTGDSATNQVANSCLAQAYLATASGSYLEKRALECGIKKPTKTWTSDSLFQKLAISVINQKMTQPAFLDILEILYGPQSIRACISANKREPYSLFDKGWIQFLVDEKFLIEVIFKQEDFNTISLGSAQEVSSVINQSLENYGYAQVAIDVTTNKKYVQVYSGSKGLGSSIRVISGTCQPFLDFPTNLFPEATAGSIWSVEQISLNATRYHCNNTDQYNLGLVDSGNYITILDPAFSIGNRGSFIIQNTGVDNGSWKETATLINPRGCHTSTLLLSGKILVCGGYNGTYLNSCELYDPILRIFTTTGSLGTSRTNHSATLLPNGKVLIAGGHNSSGNLATSELYDPTEGTFSNTGSMAYPRGAHTATLLPTGKVLIAGGFGTTYLDATELYDPTSGTFSYGGTLGVPRFNCTATLLQSGNVLICGGENTSGYLASCEIYDPTGNIFTPTGDMTIDRSTHTATLLPNNKVLIVGGMDGGYLSSAELYDPIGQTFSLTTSMLEERTEHTATLLSTGNVLICGGFGTENPSSAEEYELNSWHFASSMTTPRWSHTATLMPDGMVWVIGGFGSSLSPTTAEFFGNQGFYIEVDNPDSINEAVLPVANLGISIYSPTKFTPYSVPGCAQVIQSEGRALVDLPVTSQIISRDYSDAAYLRENSRIGISSIIRDSTGLTTITTNLPHGLILGDWFEIIETEPNYQTLPPVISGAPSSDFVSDLASGTSDLTSKTWASYDTTRPASFGRTVKDLTGNVWVVGGETELGETNSLVLFSLQNVTKNSDGARQNSYQWLNFNNADIKALGSCLTILDDPSFYNQLLIVGGANSETPSNTTQLIYSQGSSFVLSTKAVCPESVTDASLTWLGSPTSLAYLVGGRNGGGVLANIYKYNPNTNSWAANSGFLNQARYQHKTIKLDSTSLLVIGGRTTTTHPYDPIGTSSNIDAFGMGFALNSCEIVSTTLGTTFTGAMAYARYSFGTTVLPDGRILVCGGIGYNPSHLSFDPTSSSSRRNELKAVEIYDPIEKTWSSLSDMLEPHSFCFCEYIASENKVFVFGGYSSLLVEYLDLVDMRWKCLPDNLSTIRVFGAGALAGLDVPLLSGGAQILLDPNPITSSAVSLPGSATLGISSYNTKNKGLNGSYRVTNILGPSQFNYQTQPFFSSSNSGSIIKTSAPHDSRINGPFIYDTDGVAPTGTNTLTVSRLNLSSNSSVQLTSTSNFPDTGYIVFNYGKTNQLGPVQFHSISSNSLLLDSGFNFTQEVPLGSEVRLLYNKEVFTPPDSYNAFHITASSAGRLAATDLLTKISASGIPLSFNVKYPGDRGLGNSGQPTEGTRKLSDLFEIYGGDDLDNETQEARNG